MLLKIFMLGVVFTRTVFDFSSTFRRIFFLSSKKFCFLVFEFKKKAYLNCDVAENIYAWGGFNSDVFDF